MTESGNVGDRNVLSLIKRYTIQHMKKESISKDIDITKTIQILNNKNQLLLSSHRSSVNSLNLSSHRDKSFKSSKLCLLDEYNNSNSQSKIKFQPSSIKLIKINQITSNKYHTSKNLKVFSKNISELRESKNKNLTIYHNVTSTNRPKISDLELHRFIMTPLNQNNMLVCNLKIDNSKSYFNPIISLSVDNNNRKILIAEKKFHFCQSVFKIFFINSNNKKVYLGQINSNFFQNEFHFFDSSTNKTFKIGKEKHSKHELGFVKIITPCFCTRRLPQISVNLPMKSSNSNYKYNIDYKTISFSTDKEIDNLVSVSNVIEQKEKTTSHQMLKLSSLAPKWSSKYYSYYINFTGRVRLSSKKNFMLSLNKRNILQFGKVSKHNYSVDFLYPLSPFQAFCISICQINQQFYW